jgi:hypothetical protein
MYILDLFGEIVLPVGSPRHTAGTVSSQQRLIKTLGGGVYDGGGTAKLTPELPFQLVYDCKIVGNTAAGLRTRLDALREMRGAEDRLWRKAIDNNERQWATARLMEVDYTTEARHSHGLFQPLSLTFQIKTLWQGVLHGAPWYLNTGRYLNTGLYLNMSDRYALNTSPKSLTITNGGNTFTDDVTLTLEAGATPVTGLTVTVGSCHLVYSGTVAATKSLVIDCSPARMSVLNDGVADWSHLDLGGSHASEAWLRLLKGANTVGVTRTGGGTDTYLTIDFSDQWE